MNAPAMNRSLASRLALLVLAAALLAAVAVSALPTESKRAKERKLQPNHEEEHSRACSKVKLTASTSQGRCGQCNEEAQCEFCISNGSCVKRSDTGCPANKRFGEDQCASLGGHGEADAAAAAAAAAGDANAGGGNADKADNAADQAGAGATLKALEENN